MQITVQVQSWYFYKDTLEDFFTLETLDLTVKNSAHIPIYIRQKTPMLHFNHAVNKLISYGLIIHFATHAFIL
jgi:hypothetical protein